jgi:hypothetical protein
MYYNNQYNQPVTKVPVTGVLALDNVGMYKGVELSNHTGRTLYIMGVDGVVHSLIPRQPWNFVKDTSPKVCVKVDIRFDTQPVNGVYRALNINTGRYADIYITPMTALYTTKGVPTAVYLPQANVTVSLTPDTSLLRQAHPYLAPPICTDDFTFSRLVVNLHDVSKKYIYVAGTHGISKIPVMHDLTRIECIQFRVKDEHNTNNLYRLTIDDEVDLRCIDCGYDKFGLVMGLSAEMVSNTFDKLHNKIKDELNDVKEKLETVSKELEMAKQENNVLKKQVSNVVKEQTEIHEINSLKLKADIADSEYAKTKARIEADRENMPTQIQRENLKADVDLAIANAKLATAESDNSAQTWKSTAVIAGAAATLGVVATKTLAAAAVSSVAVLGATTVLPAIAIAGIGAILAANTSRVRESITDSFASLTKHCKKACSTLGSCVDSTMNFVKSAVKSVSDSGKAVINGCVNIAKSVGSTVVSATKSVCSSIGSGISSFVRRFF